MKWRFIYPDYGTPDCCPDYTAHSGQFVEIIRRKKSPEEYEWLGDAQFVVRAEDGWHGDVWHSELHRPEYPWPNTHDKNGNLVATKPLTTIDIG
jgi:hypothetical protein